MFTFSALFSLEITVYRNKKLLSSASNIWSWYKLLGKYFSFLVAYCKRGGNTACMWKIVELLNCILLNFICKSTKKSSLSFPQKTPSTRTPLQEIVGSGWKCSFHIETIKSHSLQWQSLWNCRVKEKEWFTFYPYFNVFSAHNYKLSKIQTISFSI